MLELYGAPKSTNTQRVLLALFERGMSWRDRTVALDKGENVGGDYLKINPNGLIPALVHDGNPIVDSLVILEYLEDAFGEMLRPAGALDRARMREWCRLIDEIAAPAVRTLSFHHLFGNRLRTLAAQDRADYASARPMRKDMYRRIGPEGFPEQDLVDAKERLSYLFDRIEKALQSSMWLIADEPTLADIVLAPAYVRVLDLALADLRPAWPSVAQWHRRFAERASFQQTFHEGGRVDFSGSA